MSLAWDGSLRCLCARRTLPSARGLPQQEKGKDKTLIEQGTWRSASDGSRIRLWGGIQLMRQFAIRNADTLRLLDERGREIQSTLNHDLVRSNAFDPIEQPFRKRWMYVRDADRGFAIDCIKGLRFPVAEERDMAALNTAYEPPNPLRASRWSSNSKDTSLGGRRHRILATRKSWLWTNSFWLILGRAARLAPRGRAREYLLETCRTERSVSRHRAGTAGVPYATRISPEKGYGFGWLQQPSRGLSSESGELCGHATGGHQKSMSRSCHGPGKCIVEGPGSDYDVQAV